jgi:hypothetical protein
MVDTVYFDEETENSIRETMPCSKSISPTSSKRRLIIPQRYREFPDTVQLRSVMCRNSRQSRRCADPSKSRSSRPVQNGSVYENTAVDCPVMEHPVIEQEMQANDSLTSGANGQHQTFPRMLHKEFEEQERDRTSYDAGGLECTDSEINTNDVAALLALKGRQSVGGPPRFLVSHLPFQSSRKSVILFNLISNAEFYILLFK